MGYSSWGRKEFDVTECLSTHAGMLCVFHSLGYDGKYIFIVGCSQKSLKTTAL